MNKDIIIDIVLFVVIILISILFFKKKSKERFFSFDVGIANKQRFDNFRLNKNNLNNVIMFLDSLEERAGSLFINNDNILASEQNLSTLIGGNNELNNSQLSIMLDFFEKLGKNKKNEFYIK